MLFQRFQAAAAAFALLAAGLTAGPAAASADQAQALVDKAISHYDMAGRDSAFADFMNKDGDWVDGEFYVIVANASDGLFKVHPINPKLIDNAKLWDLQDVNKAFIIRDMVAAGESTPDGGWTEYVWANPATARLAKKRTYVHKHEQLLFMVGYYE